MDSKTAKFILRAKKIHNDKYDYSKVVYQTCESKVTIVCKEHEEFVQSAGAHLSGQGCKQCGHQKNRRTISNEDFIAACRKVHGDKYDYSEVIYTGKENKVRIICSIHGAFDQNANSHKRGSGCRDCAINNRPLNKKWTTKTFIEACAKVHENRYNYDKVEYTKGQNKIIITCLVHGDFPQIARNHLNLKHGCPQCANISSALKQRFTTDQFIENARAIHGDKYDYSKVEYVRCDTDVTIICPIHGDFVQKPYDHVNRCSQCLKCSNHYSPSNEEFIENAKEVHGDKYEYTKVNYTNCDTPVIITCKKHGNFEQTPYVHVNMRCGCPKCGCIGYSKSQVEWLTFVEKFYGISIHHIGNSAQEYRIKDTYWRADGYCEETNTIYEYHGSYYHGDPKLYEPGIVNAINQKTMGSLYEKTLMREKKIKELGYNLVVMWESEWLCINKSIGMFQKKFRMIHAVDTITDGIGKL